MCGIAGVFGSNNLHRAHMAAQALQHRGPEPTRTYTDPELPFSMAHRRLAVIDCTAAAAQPMRYSGHLYIVFNGELYNYVEIKKLLEQKGYSFQTQSDTEVVVAAYACWGKDCLQQFDGAFAFAIWNEQEKTLFAARDRMGEKPFFFSFSDGGFDFASEMKALWAADLPRDVATAMLYNYLTLGYTTNPFDPTATFYQNLQQLPPASMLTYTAGATEAVIEKYWQVNITEQPVPDQEAVSTFRALLTTSVARRLRSDVPVGTSLSGGLDSSTIAALCATQHAPNYTHQCFTASFPGFEKDETALARQVATQLGMQHHVVPVGVDDLLHSMEAMSLQQETPVQSASVLAQWQVYAAAKAAGVTVLLDGQGADELLAGYPKYFPWYWRELYANHKLRASGELEAARQPGVSLPFGWKDKAAARFPHFAASLWQVQKAKKAAAQSGLHPDFVAAGKHGFAYAQPSIFSLNGALHFNTFTNGLEELLRYADRNSMAHALEVRLPFLDHQLVAFLFTLPPSLKIRSGWTKWLLRETMKEVLPQNITWRKDKTGFEPPQYRWMQDARVQREIGKARELLVEQKVLHPSVMKRPIKPAGAHDAGNLDWRYWSASYLYR